MQSYVKQRGVLEFVFLEDTEDHGGMSGHRT